MIDESRIKQLNSNPVQAGRYVLYWMQASQRVHYNLPLRYAVERAAALHLPVVVCFGLTASFPEANVRHYHFMVEGLIETANLLQNLGIVFVVRMESPDEAAIALARQASLVITDRGYLRIQRQWRTRVAQLISCPLIQVEDNVVVPINNVSDKSEYAAATIRPKIMKQLLHYFTPAPDLPAKSRSYVTDYESFNETDPMVVLNQLPLDRSVPLTTAFHGGYQNAREHLNRFIASRLVYYDTLRNDPSVEYCSNLSPYLHFGQISPIEIAIEAYRSDHPAKHAFIEELVVRRELSMNFVYFDPNYDSFACIPEWAQKTLQRHEHDTREYVYEQELLERAETHDRYWNAAQREMVQTGKMQGYMRMYWGKKILEWSRSPAEAFATALYLNNKYELDGRDPNGYAGVAWCFGKHDRPWAERHIFGNVRYMNDKGLERKFEIKRYAERWNT